MVASLLLMDQTVIEQEYRVRNSSQIRAILSLLDDPDPVVQSSIRDRLLELGELAVPALRKVSLAGENELARTNSEMLLRDIGIRKFRSALDVILASRLAARPYNGDIDLEQGAFAVALIRYPEMQAGEYIQQLDTMAALLDDRLRGCDNGYMVVREINQYLFQHLGFQGCREDRDSYFDPENSCMNRVLERRIGIPITLSVIYLLLARRLDLPFYGIGFPTRFLVKYQSPSEEFYVDAFKGGIIINYSDCRQFLREINVPYRPEFLEPISNAKTVARMLRNLVEIHKHNDPMLADELEQGIALLVGVDQER